MLLESVYPGSFLLFYCDYWNNNPTYRIRAISVTAAAQDNKFQPWAGFGLALLLSDCLTLDMALYFSGFPFPEKLLSIMTYEIGFSCNSRPLCEVGFSSLWRP